MNWEALIHLFLPIELRVRFWIDFLYSSLKPIRDLNNDLDVALVSIFFKAKQNSQQGPFGKLLSDLTGRVVVVSTLSAGNLPLTIYKEEEFKQPIYIRLEGESGGEQLYIYDQAEAVNTFAFIVSVSGAFDLDILNRILSIVRGAKLSGKRFKVIFEDGNTTEG